MLVAFGLTVAVSSFALFLFSLHQRLARSQLETQAAQHAQRAVQRELRHALRNAGRGGLIHELPGASSLPNRAIEIEHEVEEGHPVGSRTALAGTDVLTVRGVIHGPLYWVDDYSFEAATGRGRVRVRAETGTGFRQPLEMLQDAGRAGDDALILISGQDPSVHAVARIREVDSSGRGRGRVLDVLFDSDSSGGPIPAAYLALSSGGGWPSAQMTSVTRVGVLEEWRFYVRPPDASSPQGSQFAMARVYPGTEIAWGRRNSNLNQAIADHIVDFEAVIEEGGDDSGLSVTVVTTARAGEASSAALRVERTARSVVRLRNLR